MAGMNKETKDAVLKMVTDVAKTTQELVGGVSRQASDAVKRVSESDSPLVDAMKETKVAVGKVAKETAVVAKKTAQKAAVAKKKAMAPEVKEFIQFRDKEISRDAILDQVVAAYTAEGKEENTIREIQLYIKPEENIAYYVINGEEKGSVDPLFPIFVRE